MLHLLVKKKKKKKKRTEELSCCQLPLGVPYGQLKTNLPQAKCPYFQPHCLTAQVSRQCHARWPKSLNLLYKLVLQYCSLFGCSESFS